MTELLPTDSRACRRHRLMAVAACLVLALAGGLLYWQFGMGAANDPIDTFPPVGDPPAPAAKGPPWFRDVTAASGLNFTYRNGEEADQYTMLEMLGGGVALIDYDGDGFMDIFLTGGGYFDGPDKTTIKGHPCKLYRNLGKFKFQDVTKEAGLDIPWWYTHGIAVADYDRDGWPDLLVTGYGKVALFRNESDGKGGRRFADVTEKVGLSDDSWSTSAGFADLDGDGYPDLYVCHYLDWSFKNNPHCSGELVGVQREICPPLRFQPLVHALFRNEQGKAFRNVANLHGFRAEGNGLGVVLADLNDDQRPDIYVANDRTPNFLLFNRPGGKLEEKGLFAGVALDDGGRANGSMGVDAADYNGSGRPALWVTNYYKELHALYGNLGQEIFQYQSWAAGIGAIGQSFVGWGTSFVDVDNDGWEDLVFVNGHVFRNPAGTDKTQRSVLLHNVENQKRRVFVDASAQGGESFKTPMLGRGLAMGDLDNDGWPDLIVSRMNSPVLLLRNEAAADLKNHWLSVRLVGREHRDVVGSTIIVEGTTRKLTRYLKGGGSYLSANDPRILFGLGESDQVQRVTVKWSWGATHTWDNLEVNRHWELREGEAAAPSTSKRKPA